MKRMTKKLWVLALAALMLLTAAACNNTPDSNAPSTDNSSTTTALVDKDAEIVLGGYRNLAPGEKDGYYCSKILYVWEPLVTQDDNAAPVPCLAESWTMSEDGTAWTFKLREGVKFHDGEDFGADAVIANFDRMKPGVKSSSFYPLDIDSHYPGLVSYEKTGDFEIKLTFEGPAPTQLYNMVNFGSPIYSPACFDAEGNFSGIAQGTGPFKIAENVLDQYVLLERNDDYYGAPAKAKSIRVKVIPDHDTRFSALKAGEILGVMDLNAIPAALAVELKGNPDFAISTTKSTMTRFLVLNGTEFPFNDVRMRRAVSLCLDRKTIVDDLYCGFATPTTNVLNYCTPFYKDIPVEEDMEEAKRLAKEVLGEERAKVIYYVNGSEALQATEAALIATWLEQIGVDVDIQPQEYSIIREELKAGNYGIARMQQGLSNSEPATIFRRFMLTSGDHNQNYSLGYQSDEVDRLMTEASASLDMDYRTECYNRIQEISTEEFPIMPLFNDQTVIAYSTRLTGYDARIYGLELPEVAWAD